MQSQSGTMGLAAHSREDFEEWQEPLAPVHTTEMNYNDHQDDEFWDDTKSNLLDKDNYYTSLVTTKSFQMVAEGHNNERTIVHHARADTFPHGKAAGSGRRRHYLEIKANFVRHLMGTGTFGWPTLEVMPSLRKRDKKNREENRADIFPGGSTNLRVDCRADSMDSVFIELSLR